MTEQVARRWGAWDGEGVEHCHLSEDAEGARLTSALSGGGAAPYAVQYRVETDAAFQTRAVWVGCVGGPELHLARDGQGHWHDLLRDTELPALEGCLDVDIAVTPATNMLPIRRLQLALGAAQEIAVAYVPPPGEIVGLFLPRKVTQRYTRLGPQRYLYEGLTTGFSTEFEVDAQGLVIDYPGAFRRL